MQSQPGPPDPPDRRARRRAETREEILDLALGVMREDGVAGLSLAKVARRLGVKPPSLYKYFPSRHAVYDALFQTGQEAYLEVVRQASTGTPGPSEPPESARTPEPPASTGSAGPSAAAATSGPPGPAGQAGPAASSASSASTGPAGLAGLAALQAALEAGARWIMENQTLAQLLFWRPVPGFAPSAEAYAPALAIHEHMAGLIRSAVDQGELHPDAAGEEGLALASSLIAGVVSQQLANEPDAPYEEGRFTRLVPRLPSILAATYPPSTPHRSRRARRSATSTPPPERR